MADDILDVAVIGEGVSGLTAAGLLGEAGFRVTTFECRVFGGHILNVNELRPPSGAETESGAELVAQMKERADSAGVESLAEEVVGIAGVRNSLQISTAAGTHETRRAVIASGSRLKALAVPGELEFEGKGVSHCADCDGPFYRNQDVVVVGGGEWALQQALVLTRICNHVFLVHREQSFQASKTFCDEVVENKRITVIANSSVQAIIGQQSVEKVDLLSNDGKADSVPCAGVFAYVGLVPNTEYLPATIRRDSSGFIVADDKLATSMPGVSAIGGVRCGFGGLVVHAIEDGRRIAQEIRQTRHAIRI